MQAIGHLISYRELIRGISYGKCKLKNTDLKLRKSLVRITRSPTMDQAHHPYQDLQAHQIRQRVYHQ